MKKALVSVIGVDRMGIIAKVSTALFEMNINVLELSQTILDDYFTMLMIVDLSSATEPFNVISARLAETGKAMGETITIQSTDIFEAMHRI